MYTRKVVYTCTHLKWCTNVNTNSGVQMLTPKVVYTCTDVFTCTGVYTCTVVDTTVAK